MPPWSRCLAACLVSRARVALNLGYLASGHWHRVLGRGLLMIVMGRLGSDRRRVARRDFRVSGKAAVEARSVVVHDRHRPHHVVVFVVENMAMPYVTRADRRIEREGVLSREQVCFGH